MPYRTKIVIAEAIRRGASVKKKRPHAKLRLAGQQRPFTYSHSARQLNDIYVRALCKWANWDHDEFIRSISGSKKEKRS